MLTHFDFTNAKIKHYEKVDYEDVTDNRYNFYVFGY